MQGYECKRLSRLAVVGLAAIIGWAFEVKANATVIAADDAANYTTATWLTGSNEGSGFGAWTLFASSTESAGWYVDEDGKGWALSAQDDELASASRPLNESLAVGQIFSFRIQRGVGDPFEFPFAGLALTDGEEDLILISTLGQDYLVNGSSTLVDTTEPVDVEVELTDATAFVVRLTPVGGATTEVSGSIANPGNPDIVGFEVFNDNFGPGEDLFFDNLQVTEPDSGLPRLSDIHLVPGDGVWVPLQSLSGTVYRLEYTADLMADPVEWQQVDEQAGNDGLLSLADDQFHDAPIRIYRVRVVP